MALPTATVLGALAFVSVLEATMAIYIIDSMTIHDRAEYEAPRTPRATPSAEEDVR